MARTFQIAVNYAGKAAVISNGVPETDMRRYIIGMAISDSWIPGDSVTITCTSRGNDNGAASKVEETLSESEAHYVEG